MEPQSFSQNIPGVTGRMRSDHSDSVRRLAGYIYGGNGGRSVKLNYGGSGGYTDYLQT